MQAQVEPKRLGAYPFGDEEGNPLDGTLTMQIMVSRSEQREQDEPSPDDLGKYRGRWVAVVGRRIVADGTNPKDVLLRAKAHDREPVIFKVPAGEIMIL